MVRFRYRQARQHRTGSFRDRWLLHLIFHLSGEKGGPPRFLGNPCVSMPCSLTPVAPFRQAISAGRCCLPRRAECRQPRFQHFGALSHGLLTHCLRFTAPVARCCARLATGWRLPLAGWDLHPLGFNWLFRPRLPVWLPQRPGFAWRTPGCCTGSVRSPQMPGSVGIKGIWGGVWLFFDQVPVLRAHLPPPPCLFCAGDSTPRRYPGTSLLANIRKRSCSGYWLFNISRMVRVLRVMTAPIFSSFRRMVLTWAWAKAVRLR